MHARCRSHTFRTFVANTVVCVSLLIIAIVGCERAALGLDDMFARKASAQLNRGTFRLTGNILEFYAHGQTTPGIRLTLDLDCDSESILIEKNGRYSMRRR